MFGRKKNTVTQIERDNQEGEDIQENKTRNFWLKATTASNALATTTGLVIIVSYLLMPPPNVIVETFDLWGNRVLVEASQPTSPQDRVMISKEFLLHMRTRSGNTAVDADRLKSVVGRITQTGAKSWETSHKLFKNLTVVKEDFSVQVHQPVEAFVDQTGEHVLVSWSETRTNGENAKTKSYKFRVTFVFEPLKETGGLSVVNFVRLEHAEEIMEIE